MTENVSAQVVQVAAHHGSRRILVGRVVSAKMQKTVVVRGGDPQPRCPVRQVRALAAALQGARREDQYRAGDEVEIQEHRPSQPTKRFVVTRLVKKFVEE